MDVKGFQREIFFFVRILKPVLLLIAAATQAKVQVVLRAPRRAVNLKPEAEL